MSSESDCPFDCPYLDDDYPRVSENGHLLMVGLERERQFAPRIAMRH